MHLQDNRTGWVPLQNLYAKNDNITDLVGGNNDAEEDLKQSPRVINTPNQLLYVARQGLRFQIFDTVLWNDLYECALELSGDFQPRQWVQLVHIFKRIKVKHRGLLDLATRELLYHLDRLSLEDLSKLALSFAWHGYCHSDMFSRIAEVVTTRLRREKMHEVPDVAKIDDADATDPGSTGKEPQKNSALSKITSYTHLLGAFSKCEVAHKELFEAVAADLVDQIRSKEMLIPPGFLSKIFASYARFGYRHVTLFDALSKEMVTAKIPTEQLASIQKMMKALDYENDIMLNIFAYRLGNAVQGSENQ
ncbi:uncharacterized protein BXIN_1346 [Babesia sp. Xinjiang]|uniref:uncharacterized protein n=1 Tax=Babesia sp. Xinjiang TaxID=462227 RepID=UPI000A22BF73|nr:uncharacterized protein BXIN_1346 [Babesia sp. Xinjiang]ORM39896.1 hypothetical protein BXIN_1346 [Babesia sp. Xinjiang]